MRDPAIDQGPIKLVVGLANPGDEYAQTRHNAGAWLVERVVAEHNQSLRDEPKFHALMARVQTGDVDVRFITPTTYMNASGRAVDAVAKFYKYAADEILVVHDDLDLDPGTIRLKIGGGAGGNNGLKDCIKALGTQTFPRIRVGIGHPGDRNKVTDYVLSRASKSDQTQIDEAIDRVIARFNDILRGKFAEAMNELHRR